MCALKTDAERVEWSRRYQMAMHRFLRQEKSASLLPAARLGRRAVTLGLETLDVARLHGQALTALAPLGGSSRTTRHKTTERAKVFFAEAIVPIEETHRAAMKAGVRIGQLTRTLRRRTRASSVSVGQLERAIAQRQAVEAVLKQSADRHAKLLAKAERLQKQLRHQTRELLSGQEDERQKTGRELRNEIVQALVAIELSLLALGTSASANTGKLDKEIANAQRLVRQSRKRGRV